MTSEKEFVPADARPDALLSDIGDVVAVLESEAAELDCVHATSLAMLRETGERARSELVRELRISQRAVLQMEGREDMLLSTQTAKGAEIPRITVTVDRRDVELAI